MQVQLFFMFMDLWCVALYFYPYYTLFPTFDLEETQIKQLKPHLRQLPASPVPGIEKQRQLFQPHFQDQHRPSSWGNNFVQTADSFELALS